MTRAVQGIRNRKNGQQRREHILEEAQRIIGESGYHGFGLHELAQRCGMTRPGLLHHFGSKDRLLIEVLRHSDARHGEAVVELLGKRHDPSASPAEQRATMVSTFRIIIERNVAQPELMRLQVILQSEAINKSHPAHDYFRARGGAKQELMTTYFAPFSQQPQSAARHTLAVMDGLQAQWLREDQGFDLPAEAEKAILTIVS